MGNQEKHVVSRGAWAKGFFLFYFFLVVNGDLYTYFHAPVKPLMRVIVLLAPTGMENDNFEIMVFICFMKFLQDTTVHKNNFPLSLFCYLCTITVLTVNALVT